VLSEKDGERFMRYEPHIDKKFRSLMGLLEQAQRARTNSLPPPVRIDVRD